MRFNVASDGKVFGKIFGIKSLIILVVSAFLIGLLVGVNVYL